MLIKPGRGLTGMCGVPVALEAGLPNQPHVEDDAQECPHLHRVGLSFPDPSVYPRARLPPQVSMVGLNVLLSVQVGLLHQVLHELLCEEQLRIGNGRGVSRWCISWAWGCCEVWLLRSLVLPQDW